MGVLKTVMHFVFNYNNTFKKIVRIILVIMTNEFTYQLVSFIGEILLWIGITFMCGTTYCESPW